MNLAKMQEEELKRRVELERKRLPKMQKADLKTKSQQFRKTLTKDKRVSMDVEREKIKEVRKLDMIEFLFPGPPRAATGPGVDSQKSVDSPQSKINLTNYSHIAN